MLSIKEIGKLIDRDIYNLKSDEKALEIAPLNNPKLNVKLDNVKVLDRLSREELCLKYKDSKERNINDIVNVDYVHRCGSYVDMIEERFDYVFASHVIEHVPNIVMFLNNISEIMKKDGYLILIVPDKRYCFDHFKRESDLYDVILAYKENRIKPNMNSLLMNRFSTHNDPVRHWNGEHGEVNLRYGKLGDIMDELDRYSNDYIDVHNWFFSDIGFRFVVEYLYKNGLIDLRLVSFVETVRNSFNFYCVLKKEV